MRFDSNYSLRLNNMQLETVFILSFFSTSKIVTRKSWVARQFFFLDGENPDSLGVTEEVRPRPRTAAKTKF